MPVISKTNITNLDGTITVTNGSVVSISLGHANTWTGLQSFNTSLRVINTNNSDFVDLLGGIGTGVHNVLIGNSVASAATYTSETVAIGYQAGQNLSPRLAATLSGGGVFIGTQAGQNVVQLETSFQQGGVGIGYQAMQNVTGSTGFIAVAIGSQALMAAQNCPSVIAIGYQALQVATACNQSVIIGHSTGARVTTGANNTVVGIQAAENLTTGSDNAGLGKFVFDGAQLTGSFNAALGSEAMGHTAADVSNVTAVGYQAARRVSQSNLTAVGYQALSGGSQSGTNITVVGYQAGVAMTTGGSNTCLGYLAGATITTGSNNVIVSDQSSGVLTTGSNNTLIGSSLAVTVAAASFQTIIGSSVTGMGNNTVTIGRRLSDSVYLGQTIINLNAVSTLPTLSTGTGIELVGTDATIARVETTTFGANAAVTLRRADGTGALPTALATNDVIGAFNIHGYYVTGGPGWSNSQASLQASATQNWTSTAMGTKWIFSTTPNNSTTLTTALTLDQDQSATFAGNVGIGATATPTTQLYISATSPEVRLVAGATNNDVVSFYQTTTFRGLFGVAGGTNGIITGSSNGDFCVRANTQAIRFSVDNGSTSAFVLGTDQSATFASNVSLTGKITATDNNITTTSTDGVVLSNATAATVSVQQQYSPRQHYIGHAWNTTATAADNYVETICELRPQAGSSPTGNLVWAYRVSAAGTGSFTDGFTISTAGWVSNAQGTTNGEAFGKNANVNSQNGTLAIGNGANAGNTASTAVGQGATTNSSSSTAIGQVAVANDANSTAVGRGSNAVKGGIAIGSGAGAAGSTQLNCVGIMGVNNNNYTIVIGNMTGDTAANQLVMGGPTCVIQNAYFGNGPTNALPSGVTLNATGGTGTNIIGAPLKLAAGISTGSGAPAYVSIQHSAPSTTSGTTPQTIVDRSIFGLVKDLTNNNNTSVNLANFTIASGSALAFNIKWNLEASNGSQIQSDIGNNIFNMVLNQGGVYTQSSGTWGNEFKSLSSGTLTVGFGLTQANPAVLSINANSSFSTTSGYMRLNYDIFNLTNQAISIL